MREGGQGGRCRGERKPKSTWCIYCMCRGALPRHIVPSSVSIVVLHEVLKASFTFDNTSIPLVPLRRIFPQHPNSSAYHVYGFAIRKLFIMNVLFYRWWPSPQNKNTCNLRHMEETIFTSAVDVGFTMATSSQTGRRLKDLPSIYLFTLRNPVSLV